MNDPNLPFPPARHVELLHAAESHLECAVAGLDDAALQEPSHLPGWSRGHVVAHLVHNADAFAEVTIAALNGRLRETYPGGPAAREAAIERDANRPAEHAIELLRIAQTRLHQLWANCTDADWQRHVRFRDGTLAHLLASRWREVEIHHVDLGLTYSASDWSPAFAHHAIDFLMPRLGNVGIELIATDTGRIWHSSDNAMLTVGGEANMLAAWLAGRSPATELSATGGERPPLGPWP